MTPNTVDEQLDRLADLQNEIGSTMVELLEEAGVEWDETRFLIQVEGPAHFLWSLRYRQGDEEDAGAPTNSAIKDLGEEYVRIASAIANDQVRRVRFQLDVTFRFKVETWYTPTEGLPGWTWAEENEVDSQ